MRHDRSAALRALAATVVAAVVLAGCAPATDEGRGADASPSTTSEPAAPSTSGTTPGTTPGMTPGTIPGTTPGTTPATSPPSASPSVPPPASEPLPSITVPSLPVFQDRGIVEGADMSWPQCPPGMGIPEKRSMGAPLPFDTAKFVVLGLTNGPGFHPNPCLADQVAWVKQRRLMAGAYSVVSWPEKRHLEQFGGQGPFDGATRLGALSNVGYQQAMFNLQTMRNAGLEVPSIWVDVEPVPVFEWSADKQANAAVVLGAVRGYTEAGYEVGFYSTRYLWEQVVGDLRLSLPEWRAAGQTSRAEALRRCGPEAMFQGGAAVLAQWVEADRDRNVTCPGESTYLDFWFTQY
jgi:hypothetical protein